MTCTWPTVTEEQFDELDRVESRKRQEDDEKTWYTERNNELQT